MKALWACITSLERAFFLKIINQKPSTEGFSCLNTRLKGLLECLIKITKVKYFNKMYIYKESFVHFWVCSQYTQLLIWWLSKTYSVSLSCYIVANVGYIKN